MEKKITRVAGNQKITRMIEIPDENFVKLKELFSKKKERFWWIINHLVQTKGS